MNKHDVRLLQQISGYPAVSITLPTHRTSPRNKQDPIRVKQLVKQGQVVFVENGKLEVHQRIALILRY